MKEKLLGNKRNLVILIVLLIALLAGFAFGVSALVSNADSNKDKEVATKEEQVKEKKELNKKKENLEDAMDKELASAKTEEEKQAIKEKYEDKISNVNKEIAITEEKIETAEKEPAKPSPNKPKPSPAKPKPSPTPAPDPKPNKPEKVWGVVKPAWDETVTKYRTEIVEKYVCNGKYFDDYDSCYEYSEELDLQGIPNSFYLTQVEEQVPYTEVIHHEAVYGWIEK